jgi:hypothetical protein
VVQAPELYRDHACGLNDNDNYGLDLRTLREHTTNTWSKVTVRPEHLLCRPKCWATLDYRTIDNSDVDSELTLSTTRSGTAHGFAAWFDSLLMEGVALSNAPGSPAHNYANAFFPWPEPVEVAAGDKVSISIRANLVGEDYVWRWETSIGSEANEETARKQFSQTTFLGAALSANEFRKRAADYVPRLNEDGEIARCALDLMGDGLCLQEIARLLAAEFPGRFRDRQQALDHLGDLSRRYS